MWYHEINYNFKQNDKEQRLNYRNEFEHCFSYIERHLKDNLTVSDLANEMGYSIYHFCRIFYAYQGMTPMEYVKARRLQAASAELSEGRKIIDIAYEYGFETASGFSKAFKQKYQMTPLQMKKSMNTIQKDNLTKELISLPITYVVKEIDAFNICGYCVEMDFESANYSNHMAAYWNNYDDNDIEEHLYQELNPKKHGEIGIVIRENVNCAKHKYLLGVMAHDNNPNTDWFNYKISAGKYIVITSPPVDMTCNDNDFAMMVKNVWAYIFNQWFKTTDFTYDESREAFEYYDERCHYRKDSVMDIYLPIL